MKPAELTELAPLLRRMVTLDPKILVRIRVRDGRAMALVRTPFDVLAARSVAIGPAATASTEATAKSGAASGDEPPIDVTFAAAAALAWIDGETAQEPDRLDAQWRTALPPESGWQHIEQVPDQVIRQLVRAGALTLKEAAEREGVPGASPRAEVADALLDSVVLTVTADHAPLTAEVTLRVLSALTRLGFLAREGGARVDRNGRWVRVVGTYGTVYLESAPSALSVLR